VQDRPDASELLAALRVFLLEEVAPAVPDELRFSVRVAANVCAMLEREAALGDAPAREEVAALAELLDAGPGAVPGEGDPRRQARDLQGQLARAIRAGEMDERLDETVAVLRQQLVQRLRVAHPGWESFTDGG
jgi:Domain of unknown function (DUF6285)